MWFVNFYKFSFYFRIEIRLCSATLKCKKNNKLQTDYMREIHKFKKFIIRLLRKFLRLKCEYHLQKQIRAMSLCK